MKVLAGMVALAALALPAQLTAQSVYIGAGITIPVSDYSDYANTGFMTAAGVMVPVGEAGFSIFGEGFFGQNNHEGGGEKTTPLGVMAGVDYSITGNDDRKGVYFFGEAGLLVHRYVSDTEENSSDSGLGFGAGAGGFFPLGGVNGWLEGRAMNASIDGEKTTFLGFLFGISIPIAQN